LAVCALIASVNGCQTVGSGQKTATGLGVGAVAGAVVGGLWGGARGNWKEGALIGAGVGAAVGGVTGAVMDKQSEDMRKAGIATQRDQAGNMIVSLAGNSLNFETGQAVIGDVGQTTLTNLAGVLVKYPENRIAIYGFTDNVGDDASNRLLSQQRADSVKLFLLQQNVPQRCILGAVGYGPAYPVADNSTPEGRAANRRVTLRISVDQAEAKTNEAQREQYQSGN
jgi:outer membrane protein OmpA-like peptidoglycan-associated protein